MGGFIRSISEHPEYPPDRACFPFTLPVFRDFYSLDLHPKATFFSGENGSGKSTLLEAIAINYGLPAEGGRRDHVFSTFDSHSDLYEHIRLDKTARPHDYAFFRAETFYNLATYLTQSGGHQPSKFGFLHRRSHGEGFLDAVAALHPPGLFLFDEPESALSIQGQLAFLALMQKLVDEGSQLVIATHSPIILGFGEGQILGFSPEGISPIAYEDTQSYRLTLDFLKNRGRYAGILGLKSVP